MYTVCTVKGRHTWRTQLIAVISAPVCGRYPSGCATFACTNPRPVTCVADWFLALVNNSSESNVKHAPSIMHCLPRKQPGWEMTLKWNGRHGMDGIVAPLSLGPGHHWHPPAPRTDCPAPFVSRGQSKDDKKQMEMLAPGLSSCTPAACERLPCCELHIRISSTALPHGSPSLAPITLV